MTWLKQSVAVTIKLGPFVNDADGKTAETGLTIAQADVRLSKNGGDFAQKNDANAATHDENGYYDVSLNATDTGTLGRLRVAVSEAGALPVWADFEVVPAQVWDSYFASDRLQVDTRELGDANLALTTQMKADVNAEADTALSDYDAPTNAEMNARTLPSADYFDPATDTVANVTTVGSVTGAVGSVTGNVGGAVAGSVASVTAGVTVTTNNDKTGYALTAAYDAAKNAAAPGAQMDLVDAPNATAVAAIQAGLATSLEIAALNNVSAGEVADAVWDEDLADHLGAGSTGAGLNAAGSAGDPWATALPGGYGAGSAGNILGNRLDAAVSGRAPANEYDAVLDAAISSRLAGASYTAPDNAGISSLLDRLTALRSGYLDKLDVTGTLAHSDAADTYKADVSALATAAGLAALNDVSAADVRAQADAALAAYDAATSAELTTAVSGLAAETTAQSIKAKTDQLTFTTPNKVDASAEVTVDAEAIAEAVAEVVGETVAGEVWEHTSRTLTQPSVSAAPSAAGEVVRRRGDDWEVTFSGLSLDAWTEIWLTIKRSYADSDAAALLQATATEGLVRLNGAVPASAGPDQAMLTVSDANDAVTFRLRAAISAQLEPKLGVYDLQWMDATGGIYTVSAGRCRVLDDVTRATG